MLSLAAMEKYADEVDLGELFARARARVRDDPGMRARSRRTILKIELNREELFPIELDMDSWGPPGQRKPPKLAKVQKPDWNTSARAIARRASGRVYTNPGVRIGAFKGERDDRLRNHPQEVWSRFTFRSGHTSVSCVLLRLNVATWQPIVVNLATKRTS